jgi:hypothetical protein
MREVLMRSILLLLFYHSILMDAPQKDDTIQSKAAANNDAISILNFDIKSLPKNVKYRGAIVMGARWIDKNGENILILTQTGKFPSKGECGSDDPCFDAEVYAYNYVKKEDSLSLLWKTVDFERECVFDLYAGFMEKALFITDLDSNGVAETTFLYMLTCRSDVSPSRLKLIMHEGATKYAIRGTTKLGANYGVEESGGEMKIDPAFAKAKPAMKTFAIQKWNQYVTEDEFKQF